VLERCQRFWNELKSIIKIKFLKKKKKKNQVFIVCFDGIGCNMNPLILEMYCVDYLFVLERCQRFWNELKSMPSNISTRDSFSSSSDGLRNSQRGSPDLTTNSRG